MPDFNRVVIRDRTKQQYNIHLAVHPFHFTEGIRMMSSEDAVDDFMTRASNEHNAANPLTGPQARLAKNLMASIPGIQHLFFANGAITIQHTGVFDDKAIIAAAKEIIEPFLTEQLTLDCVYADVAGPDA